MDKGDWIIQGDTEKYNNCLIYVCGQNELGARNCLNRMLNTPTDEDKRVMETHSNLRIELIKPEDCWWRYGLD